MMINNTRLEELREENDLKQIDLANIFKIAKSTYSEWEHNKIPIPTKRVIQIANYYKVNIDYLLNISNIRTTIDNVTSINLNKIGDNIKYIRNTLKLSQNQLADMLSIDQTTLSKYELGKSLIQIDTLIGLSKLSNISIDYILGRTNNPKINK